MLSPSVAAVVALAAAGLWQTVSGVAVPAKRGLFPAIPAVGTTINSYVSLGCYTDSPGFILANYIPIVGLQSIETCISTCSGKGYAYAGISNGLFCYCDNTIRTQYGGPTTADQCNVACSGNLNENCGGLWTNVMFQSQQSIAAAKAAAASAAASASASASVAAASASASASAAASVAAASASASASAAASVAAASSAASISAASASASASVSAAAASAAASTSASISRSISASVASASASVSAAAASVSASISASAAASASSAAAAALATTVPTGWSASSPACIAEGSTGRALTGASTSAPDMTLNKCITYCSSRGFTLSGVEYSSECYCGDFLQNGASLNVPSTACNMPCSGSGSSTCGGPNAINLYVSNAAKSALTSDLTAKKMTLPSGWAPASTVCVAEGTSGRALASASFAADDMTIPKCLNYCQTQGWQYAGVEFGRECYCGDQLVNGASLSKTATCSSLCAGDSATNCGGANALQLYNNPSLALNQQLIGGYSYQGCIKEVAGRALTGLSASQPNMTVDVCVAMCKKAGFALAGVEYGSECYCDSKLQNGASASDVSQQCNMPCANSNKQICGGPNAIGLYKAN